MPPGKDGSRLRASELLPVCAERFGRKRDDGRAEAALMALCGFTHQPTVGAQLRDFAGSDTVGANAQVA